MSRLSRPLLPIFVFCLWQAGPAGAASVSFLQTDTATLGNWKGVYGQEGNVIAQHSVLAPSYASFNTAGAVNVFLADLWATDPRALLKQYFSYSATERVESYFHTITSMDFPIAALDGGSHRIALYFADYENRGRSVTVQAIDTATNAVLDSRPLTNYQAGVYLVYNYAGSVTFRIVNNNPGQFSPTGSVNAFFWGGGASTPPPPPPPPPPADTAAPSVSIATPAAGNVSGAVNITATAGDNVGVASVQYQLDNSNLGSALTASPYSFSWNTLNTSNGAHTLTAIARDAAGNSATSAPVTVNVGNTAPPPPPPSGNAVSFVGTDTGTLGNWKGVYGQDGNVIAQHSTLVPPYATFNTGGAVNLYLLDLWATDPRALLKQSFSFSPTERIESYFHTITSMDFTVTSNDRQSHRIALYFADYQLQGRSNTVQVIDPGTGATLDSRALADYSGGVYLVYTYSGNVTFRIINNNPGQFSPTAAVSAFFWGGGSSLPPPPPPGDTTKPTVSIASPAGGATVTGTISVTASANDNVGVTSVQYQLDNSNFGSALTTSPYTLSWNTTTAGNGLHTLAAIASDAAGNTQTASIQVNVNNTTTPPPPPPPPPASGNAATFLGTDTITKGDWKGVYGQDGNFIAEHSYNAPPYSIFNPINTGRLLVDIWTTDPRAPLKYAFSFSPTERVMSNWYNRFFMDFQVSATDSQQHRIAIYCADWQPLPPVAAFPDKRSITVQALDSATGAVLDSRQLTDYTGGVYLVYNYSGNITFHVVNNWEPLTTNPNAAVTAFFWGGSGLPH